MAGGYPFSGYDGIVVGSSVAEHMDREVWGPGQDDFGLWCPVYDSVVVEHFGIVGGQIVDNNRISPAIQRIGGETSSSYEGSVESAVDWPGLGRPTSLGIAGNEKGGETGLEFVNG